METREVRNSVPSIAIIGGGFGGICAAIQLEKQLGLTSYTIFDENEQFGGTWWANKYPGSACDIQSHLYSLSFELNPEWTQNYPSQPEILDYMLRVCGKYGLYKKVRFLTQVQALKWDGEAANWEVSVLDKKTNATQTLRFDYTINAVGPLRAPYIPEEFKKFTGHLIHSAQYDPHLDLTNKTVGIIGSGASAIQIIPEITSRVKELHCYQRTPGWVFSRSQFTYSPLVKKLFALFPFTMWLFRCLLFFFDDIFYFIFKTDSIYNDLATRNSQKFLAKQIPDENLREKLKPNFKIGCKRILIHENYYPSFNQSHVHLHREKIVNIQGQNIVKEDGSSQKLDILILATGFRVQDYFFPMTIRVRDNVDLLSKWKVDSPSTYYGIMANDTPNSFFLLGPNTTLAHGSVVFMIECQVNFALQVLKETMRRGARTVCVRKDAEEKWMKEIMAEMKTMVWGTESCSSWYGDSKGRITALWPKNCVDYYRETRKVNFTKMDFTY